MRYTNDLAFSAVAVESTDVINSDWIDASSMFQVSVQVVTAGSNPTGALKLQFSDDNPTHGDPSNASDVTSATVSTTTNGVYAIQKTEICAMWVRLVYTNSSGSGTVTARLKSNGA